MVVVVEKGVYDASLVQLAPLKLMTSKGSLSCGVTPEVMQHQFPPLHGVEGYIRLFGGCSVGGLQGV
jgi:hypothetical protein